MEIRSFQPGDEAGQVAVYNMAAGALPRFKPATLQEVQRRVRARDFDPRQRWYAVANGQIVGYCNFSANGRVSYPWHLPGYEAVAEPLFERVLAQVNATGIKKVFAAYRKDWPSLHEFFLRHGFTLAREMINFVIDLVDMPTPAARASSAITPLFPEDIPAVFALEPKALRVETPAQLYEHLFRNPHFSAESVYALRNRQGEAVAVGVLVTDPTFADPKAVDADMPCFRLGAFGTETMQVKRVKGMFSFLARQETTLFPLAMDLMGQAAFRLRDHDDVEALAAQCGTDVPRMLSFYERNFKRQGSFPVFEKIL